MKIIAISVDQLWRPQPGGIATYVRGLAAGLSELDDASLELVGVAPRGIRPSTGSLPLRVEHTLVGVNVLTRLWPTWPLGVPKGAGVVHATSMAGPFSGGTRSAVHSVAMHDLLWRDEPASSTTSGIRFHESRLKLICAREELRIIVTSPGLVPRLVELGVTEQRIHLIRLGVRDGRDDAASVEAVRELLAQHGVRGPFTLYVGTREPRKNLERLLEAHRLARATSSGLGDLVIVGPSGWGAVATGDATVLGTVSRRVLDALYRDATVLAYVPRAEGWGLPPVEALAAGTRVVASTTTPSVEDNVEAVRVEPLDVQSIAEGLVEALRSGDDEESRQRRRASVADLTWRNVALEHLAAWQ